MKFFPESTDQVTGALRSMPVKSQMLSLGLILVIAIGFGLMLRGSQAAETEYLFGGRTLGEQELASVEMAFSRAQLDGWNRDERRIRIPSDRRTDYLSALDENAALPMSLKSSVKEAIDKASVFEPTSQRIARNMHAKEQDLGHRLSAFPEIQWAIVEHDLGERTGLTGSRSQSASVVVHPEGTQPLPAARIEMVREFIRGSYADMKAKDVVVIDTNADPTACPSEDPIARRKREEEAHLKQEVQEILLGYGPIRVHTYVQIEPQNRVATNSPSVQPEPALVKPTGSRQRIVSAEENPSLLKGWLESVASGRNTRVQASKQPVVPENTIASVAQPLTDARVQSLHLSIGLPESYYQRAWEQAYLRDNPGTDTSEIPAISRERLTSLQEHTKTNITRAVTPAIMSHVSEFADNSSRATIEVWSFPEFGELDTLVHPTATAFTWLTKSWQPLALLLFALVATILIYSASRSKGQRHPLNTPGAELAATREPALSDIDPELASLIQENPDRAASVLRGWIADAA